MGGMEDGLLSAHQLGGQDDHQGPQTELVRRRL